MQHFTIAFEHLGRKHSARVQKISISPIQFVVYNVHPDITRLPLRLVFTSNAKEDQLVYQSFQLQRDQIIRTIGESLFCMCHLQRISIHA